MSFGLRGENSLVYYKKKSETGKFSIELIQ